MMSTHTGSARPRRDDSCSYRDVDLDLDVGLRVEGYRWVEWNHAAMGHAPLDRDGRFVAHPGDLLAHLHMDARPGTPPGERPYVHLPRYSSDPGPALRAAERAGLFRGTGVVISCSPEGVWRLQGPTAVAGMEDECLPRLLSRAALRLARRPPEEDAHGKEGDR